MVRIGIALALGLCAVGLVSQAAETAAPSGDPYIGTYVGHYAATGREDTPVKGTLLSEGPGLYRLAIQCTDDVQGYAIELHGQQVGPRVAFYGFSSSVWWDGEAKDGVLVIRRGEQSYGGVFELEKIIQHSPTEGLKPPEGAVEVLAYEEGMKPDISGWTNDQWIPMDDGSMQVKPYSGSSVTKQSFGDMQMHFEFRLPHMGTAHGQGRSNSGLYVQQRYEIQILDSFGVLPGSGDCGGIYQVAAPRVNASLPPGQWQTYDIVFRAPRFDANGAVTEPARLTLSHNGTIIHQNLALPKPTPGGVDDAGAAKAPILLQDHHNDIRFRNIWVIELDDAAGAMPPMGALK